MKSMPGQRSKQRVTRRPRVPLPRQRGGAHEDKTKRPFRQRKHKKKGGLEIRFDAALRARQQALRPLAIVYRMTDLNRCTRRPQFVSAM